ILSFRVTSLPFGTLTLNGNPVQVRRETPTPVIEGTLISTGQSVVWTPDADVLSPLTVTTTTVGLPQTDEVAINVSAMAAGTVYEVTIDGTPFEYESVGTDAPNVIADALKATIEAGTGQFTLVTVVTPAGGGLARVLQLNSSTAFTTQVSQTLPAFEVRAYDGVAHSAAIPVVTVPVVLIPNTAPTLSTITRLDASNTTGSPNPPSEDLPLTITYADLLAASDLRDINEGDNLLFQIEEVQADTFTLTKNGNPVTVHTTTLGVGESLVWRGQSNASGIKDAFKVVGFDGQNISTPEVQVQINVAPVNDAPTLTMINSIGSVAVGQVQTISHTNLKNESDAADIDVGDQIDFRIVTVSTGTLTIGGLPVVPGTTILQAGDSVQWTVPAGAKGATDAFTVVAHDGTADSSPPIQVKVNVVNSAPTFSAVTPLSGAREDTEFTILYSTLLTASDANDPNDDALAFRIEEISSGTLLKQVDTMLTVTTTPGVVGGSNQADLVTITSGGKAQVTIDGFATPAVSGATSGDIAANLVTVINAAMASGDVNATANLSGPGDSIRIVATTPGVAVMTTTAKQLAVGVTLGVTTVGTASEGFLWTPATNANSVVAGGPIDAFKVIVTDGTVSSPTAVQVSVNVLEAADPPTLSTI
ncbi:MAG: hypothetical protein ABGZ17_04155, partial [Planctomycetaceae bacterium]